MNNKKDLIENLDKIHTTKLGIERVRKNLKIDDIDIIKFIVEKINLENSEVRKQGKNYYVYVDNYVFTINSSSYTVITAKLNN